MPKPEYSKIKLKQYRHQSEDQDIPLKEQYNILDLILNNTDTQLAYLDVDFNFIKVNSAYKKDSGLSAKQLIGKNHFDLFPSEENQKNFEKVRDSGQPLEFRARRMEFNDQSECGNTEWDWILKPVKNSKGETLGLVVSLNKVTDCQKIEKELIRIKDELENRIVERTNESLKEENIERHKIESDLEKERRRLFSVLEELPASVHLLRPDHSIFYANRYFREQFGEVKHKPCFKLLHGQEIPCDNCRAFDVFKSQDPCIVEEKHADGKIYNIYNYPFIDSDGSKYVLQLGIDISERKKAEEALQKSEQRFRSLVNSMEDTVFTLDLKKRIHDIYGNLFEKLGINAKGSAHKNIQQVFGPANRSVHAKAIQKAFKGKNVIYEWVKEVDDEIRYIQNSLSPMINNNGRTIGLVGVAREITAQKNLEKQLIQAEKLMTMAEMSAMISHEFRNSLTSVRMILELQTESVRMSLSEKKSMSVALSAIAHMEDIVTQLLNFSRPGPVILRPGHINAVIQESIDFTQLQLKKEKIRIKKVLDQDLPVLDLDRKQFKEAMINLILNAIVAISMQSKDKEKREIIITAQKYTMEKTHRDSALQKSTLLAKIATLNKYNPEIILHKGQNCLLLKITDTGIGIEKKYLKQIFQPFFTTLSGGGTGLGLSMVKRTINNHGGIIDVQSQMRRGTTFSIYLPLNN